MEQADPDDPCTQGVEAGDKFNLKCSYCRRNFSSRQNLREHLYIHTGEKPYKCTVSGCGAEFRQGSLFSIHKKAHREEQHPKPDHRTARAQIQYPKLSELLKQTHKEFHFGLGEVEKKEWLEKIGDELFVFVKTYLQNIQ